MEKNFDYRFPLKGDNIVDTYMNSATKEDKNALVMAAGKLYFQKYGKEAAIQIQNKLNSESVSQIRYSSAWMDEVIDLLKIESVDFSDPMDGSFSHQPYISIK